jgi:hypothetical protein
MHHLREIARCRRGLITDIFPQSIHSSLILPAFQTDSDGNRLEELAVYHIGLTRQEIEHLQTLIARLDAQQGRNYDDKRVHPRIDFCQPMWLNLPTESGKPWIHIYSRNLSTGGLSFLTRNLFYTDQHLVISHELNEMVPLLVLCRVCFCRPIDLGVQEVGLAFEKVLPDPNRLRAVPPEWLSLVVQNDWLARHKTGTTG